jgi:small GTP-binding protein
MLRKKVCLLGAYGVGKTSLVRRFVESIFDERYQTTVGVKIDKKTVEVEATSVTLMIWDLAGEDELEQVRLSHLRGAAGYILVVDGCRGGTLEVALALQKKVEQAAGRLPWILAANKADLIAEWEIDPRRLEAAVEGTPLAVMITSAKTGDRVEEMFEKLAGYFVIEEMGTPEHGGEA